MNTKSLVYTNNNNKRHKLNLNMFLMLYSFAWWIESIVRFNYENKRWPVMFTHWTTTLQLIYLVIVYFKIIIIDTYSLGILSKVVTTSTSIVTLLFWLLIVPSKYKKDPDYKIQLGEIHSHGINLIICFIHLISNLYKNNQQLVVEDESIEKNNLFKEYLISLLVLELYLFSYFLFTYVYWLFDKTKNIIYQEINFNNLDKTFRLLMSIFLLKAPFLTFIFYLIELTLTKFLFIFKIK
jgi:hypothetical protein